MSYDRPSFPMYKLTILVIIFNLIEDVLDDMFNTHWRLLLLIECYWLFARCQILEKKMDMKK